MTDFRVCAIDPAYRKCGIIVLNAVDQCILYSHNADLLGAECKSVNQTDKILTLWRTIQATIDNIA